MTQGGHPQYTATNLSWPNNGAIPGFHLILREARSEILIAVLTESQICCLVMLCWLVNSHWYFIVLCPPPPLEQKRKLTIYHSTFHSNPEDSNIYFIWSFLPELFKTRWIKFRTTACLSWNFLHWVSHGKSHGWNKPSTEYEQKFQSRLSAFTAFRTFCRKTPWPALLQSTELGNNMLILNTLCADFDAVIT